MRRLRRAASDGPGSRAALALLLCLCLSCCGSSGRTRSSPSTSSKLLQAQRTHEYPSPPPPAEQATGGAGAPIEAVRAFASAYINWTAVTVADDMRTLAAQSVGQARSAMELAAADTAQDYELQRGGIANSGSVEAIAPLAGAINQFVVVTRELTTATATTAYQGLHPAWHVAVARAVELSAGRWVVSGWQPES